MQNDIASKLPAAPTGYSAYDEYVAQRFSQGGREHFGLAFPIMQVPMILPVPNPDLPLEDNRQVRLGHAQAFADYVRQADDWHSGPLTIRTTSSTVIFEVASDFGTMQIGTLKVPRNNRAAFRIIDGQHRTLGFQLLMDQLNASLVKAKGLLAAAKRNGDPGEVIRQHEKAIDQIEKNLARVAGDSIGIDLVIEDLHDKARQVFVDVANNALGITKAVKDRFDSRKVVNRALNILLDDPALPQVLRGKVDEQQDRVTGNNPNILGAGHVADIIRIVTKGIAGRVSAAEEKTLDERRLASTAINFFSVAENAFSDLSKISKGTAPGTLRDKSLVVSVTMLRALAGAYHELSASGMSDSDIEAYFKRLDKHMVAPVTAGTRSGDLWLSATPRTNAFTDGATAPEARAQQVKELSEVLTSWATTPPSGL